MDEIIKTVLDIVLTKQSLAFTLMTLFAAYQTWRIMRIEADREKDRNTWIEETKTRQAAFSLLGQTLNRIETSLTLVLEIIRERRR